MAGLPHNVELNKYITKEEYDCLYIKVKNGRNCSTASDDVYTGGKTILKRQGMVVTEISVMVMLLRSNGYVIGEATQPRAELPKTGCVSFHGPPDDYTSVGFVFKMCVCVGVTHSSV